MSKLPGITLSFTSLISAYKKLQSGLVKQVRALASSISTATPGSFILIQFQMSQVTQIGESISNLIAQVNTLINAAVRNQRTQ
ncbi:MAG: hypothetical protein KGJ02_07885 [Verrucomicrobiota bacterium]|nr:hypothetical protein [Verrucomicrobiota bacterium]